MAQFIIPTRGVVLALAVLGATPVAVAQTSPYYIGLNQRFTHYSNVLQTSGSAVSDTVSSTSLVAGLDQPIGRQRLFGSLTASANRYQDLSALDYNGYSARLGLDWSTIERISGTLVVDASQTLADFNAAGLGGVPVTGENTTRTQGIRAIARIGVVTRMTGEAMLSHRTTRFSNALYAFRELDVDEGSIGLRYRPGGTLGLGAAVRLTKGKYPAANDAYDANNLDLTADWAVSGASELSARISLGRTDYDTANQRDFSGVTGSLGWRWQPTGKITLNTSLSRTAGDETLPRIGQDDIITTTTANRVSNALAVSAAYQVTAKIALRAGVALTDASVVTSGGGTAKDRTQSLSLGAVWEATRNIRVGCDISRSSRDAATGVSAYDSDSFGCFGQVTLR